MNNRVMRSVVEAAGAGGNLLLRYTGDSNSRSFVPFNGRLLAEYYCGGMIFDHRGEEPYARAHQRPETRIFA